MHSPLGSGTLDVPEWHNSEDPDCRRPARIPRQVISMQASAVAVITEDIQNDVVAALHVVGVGHLTRVIRRERGDIATQLRRAGIDPDLVPDCVLDADRVVLVSPDARNLETACVMLQKGATSAWTLNPGDGWHAVDDETIEIAATRELPARPPAPTHVSGRTFRRRDLRRRHRRSPAAGTDTSSPS